MKDSIATISVSQMDQLINFLKRVVTKAIMDSDQSSLHDGRNLDLESSTVVQNSSWIMGEKRLVRGHVVKSSATVEKTQKQQLPPPSSPFSNAFFDDTIQPSQPPTKFKSEMKAKSKQDCEDLSSISFDDAFLDSATTSINASYDFEETGDKPATSSLWTRQRIKGLESKIAAIVEDSGAGGEKISLTKEMLGKAEVVAQVEEKFIIVKTKCNVLCAVDQHAADERVALEKLEGALFNPEMHDDMLINMTNKAIRVGDILRQTKLNPAKRINLTQKDMSTVKHHWSLLQKWKFTFEESEDGKTLVITGLPSVCDRLASVNDFLDFVKELGHFTGGEMKPAFVKTVLASNACRYAVMFGDSLAHDQCVDLIS